jgi:two-component system, OmpR family, response regulator MtrA
MARTGKQMNILIVDDDPDIRELVAFKLRQMGYSVRVEKDGELGIAAAIQEQPDLMLLDVMMPKISGIEMCRRLRENEATAHIPIILITAKTQEADVERGFAAGANDYIVKPFSPRDLVSRVENMLAPS